jgi:uncharacterized protein (TIGR03435 family)
MQNSLRYLLYIGRPLCLVSISTSVAVPSTNAQAANPQSVTTSSPSDTTIRPDLAFAVVSIKPVPDTSQRSFDVSPKGDEYRAFGKPLGFTLLMAYFPIRIASEDRVIGAPGWVWNEGYDFVGKVGEADLPQWQQFSQLGFMAPNPMLETMLQNALASRCKLVVHRVPAQVDGFALVIANRGPNPRKLVESKPDDAIPDKALPIALGGRMVPIFSHDEPVLHFYQTSMAAFVLEMSGTMPIEDKTGLPGKYRFDLTRLGTGDNPPSDWNLAPLGLRLIPVKIPTEKIVIDHIERPSPN